MARKKSSKPDKQPPKPSGPVALSSVKVPDKLGGGEVRLYDAWKAGLPDLVDMPPEKKLAVQFWLCHFPSRRSAAVMGDRLEGMRLLRKIEKGEQPVELIPQSVKSAPARARARAGAKDQDQDPPASLREGTELEDGEATPPQGQRSEFKATPLPGDLSFDQAMKSVFPNQRITANLERLERLQKPVFDRDGNLVAWQDDAMAQIAAAKLVIEHAQGRAGEKPPPPPDKKRISYEELEKMIFESVPTLQFFEGLIARAKVKQAADAAQAAPATSQPEAETK